MIYFLFEVAILYLEQQSILVKRLILIRGITIKAYFLVIFGGVLVSVTLPLRHTDLQQVGFGVCVCVCFFFFFFFVFFVFMFCFYLFSLFVYSCPTSFSKKYDLLSLLGKQIDLFLGTWYTFRKVTFFA